MTDNKEALEALDDLQSCFDMEWTSSADGMFETIRKALQKPQVDVEGLKCETVSKLLKDRVEHIKATAQQQNFSFNKAQGEFEHYVALVVGHLHEQGYLRTPAVTKEEAQAAYDWVNALVEATRQACEWHLQRPVSSIENEEYENLKKLLKEAGAE